MKKRLFRRVRPSDPLLTSRWLDVTCAVMWALYLVYALATLISPLQTFELAGAPDWYAFVWSIGVAGTAGTATLAAHWMFYDGRVGLLFKKRLERDALTAFMAFMVLYGLLLVDVVIHGSIARLAQIVIVALALPLPTFRVFHLRRRIRALVMAGELTV